MRRACLRVLAVLSAVPLALVLAPAAGHASFANDFGVFVSCVQEVDDENYTATFTWVNAHDTQMIQTGPHNQVSSTGSPGPQPTVFPANTTSTWETAAVPKYATVRWQLGGAQDTASWSSSPRCRVSPSVVTAPVLVGDFRVGARIRAVGGDFNLPQGSWRHEYHWIVGCPVVTVGRVHSTDEPFLDLIPADVGLPVQVIQVVRDPVVSAMGESVTSDCDANRVVGTPPRSTGQPSLTGQPVVGETLGVTGSSWSGTPAPTTAVVWERCDTAVCAEVGSGESYAVDAADVGARLRAVVTATNDHGSAGVTTAETGRVLASDGGTSAAPVTLAFGTVPVGAQSLPQTVVLTNDSPAPVSVGEVSVSGGHFAHAGGTCAVGTELASGQACTASVRFVPTAMGRHSGTLTFGPRSVPLTGTGGEAAVMAVSARSLNLGKARVRKKSKPRAVTVRNTGRTPLIVTGVALSGIDRKAFRIANGCTRALKPGQQCTVKVTMKPRRIGKHGAGLRIDAATGTTYVELVGKGVRKKR